MFKLDSTKRAARMMAGGRVTLTFRSPTGTHITLAFRSRAKDGSRWINSTLDNAMVVFIQVPNSGGYGDKVGKITRAKGFVPDHNADASRVWCVTQALAYLAGNPTATGLEVFEEERCGCCGRQLTDPVSIERGIGPECYGRLTGSEHETKVKLTGTPVQDGGRGVRAERIAPDGVAYGVGDWRARKDLAKALIAQEGETIDGSTTTKTKRTTATERNAAHAEALANCSQLNSLPGTTFEDIFA